VEKWRWAWLAGLFEGEGYICFCNKNGVSVRIGMTDEDVIDTVHRLFPTSSTYRREMKNRVKPLYVWQVTNKVGVTDFLEGVLPYLHERRGARAREALERLKHNRGPKSDRTHCAHGHLLSGDNLYIRPYNGTRACRACRTRRDRERRPRTRPVRI
jgi:hypothetical protein